MARKARTPRAEDLEPTTVEQVIDELIALACRRGFKKANTPHLFMGVAATILSDDRDAFDGVYQSVRRGMYGKPAPEIGKAKRMAPPTSDKPSKGKAKEGSLRVVCPADNPKGEFKACPLCGEKDPKRFVRQRDGHYWCHKCRAKTTALPAEAIAEAKRACKGKRGGEE
jgi:hypothetical protein